MFTIGREVVQMEMRRIVR